MLEGQDAFLSGRNAVFLTNRRLALACIVTNMCLSQKPVHAENILSLMNTMYCMFGAVSSFLCHLLLSTQSTGLLQSHQQTGPNQSNVPQ